MHQKTIKRGNWFEIYDGPCFTLARRLPARFDISREISMPLMSAPRLARQIRQDIWRKLQSIRGFCRWLKSLIAGRIYTYGPEAS